MGHCQNYDYKLNQKLVFVTINILFKGFGSLLKNFITFSVWRAIKITSSLGKDNLPLFLTCVIDVYKSFLSPNKAFQLISHLILDDSLWQIKPEV